MKVLKVNPVIADNVIIRKVQVKAKGSLILPETNDAKEARVGLITNCGSEHDGKYVLYNIAFAKKVVFNGENLIFLPIRAILAFMDVTENDEVSDIVEVDMMAKSYNSGWNACGMPEVEDLRSIKNK